ncbi:PIN domain-containing protein [Paenarthrobacter sp. NPDC090520]|uniref:PIN domain-containing protein n=1 Tax=Paenarthrobacter sp. NPDC090520 TaxID=3364382 RepID=UPI00382A2DFF
MRDLFRGYHKPTTTEIERIWEEGIITLDTNLLLFFYDVRESTANEHFDALSQRQNRLWIPYQVADEFYRNTHKQRAKQTEAHRQRINRITTFKNELGNFPTQSRLKATAAQGASISALEAYLDELTDELKAISELTDPKNPDVILDRITQLFDGRIGPKPGKQQLDGLFKDGAKRFAEEVPPGYMDAKNKPGNRKFGDYLLWKQLMEHAASEKRDVIFVTEDSKEDWWMKLHPSIPRPELIQEFREETGQDILIMKSAHFYQRLVRETVGSDRQGEVEAALQEMEAVAEAQAASREFTIDSIMHQVTLAHPVGATPNAIASARQLLLNRVAEGCELDNTALDLALREAVRVDHAQVVSEIDVIESRANALEAQMVYFPPESAEAEHCRRRAEDYRSPICHLVDRRTQLEVSGMLP